MFVSLACLALLVAGVWLVYKFVEPASRFSIKSEEIDFHLPLEAAFKSPVMPKEKKTSKPPTAKKKSSIKRIKVKKG